MLIFLLFQNKLKLYFIIIYSNYTKNNQKIYSFFEQLINKRDFLKNDDFIK